MKDLSQLAEEVDEAILERRRRDRRRSIAEHMTRLREELDALTIELHQLSLEPPCVPEKVLAATRGLDRAINVTVDRCAITNQSEVLVRYRHRNGWSLNPLPPEIQDRLRAAGFHSDGRGSVWIWKDPSYE